MSRSYGTTNAARYATAPAVGTSGDSYWNTTDKSLYLSDGTTWVKIGPTTHIGADAPASPTVGQLWWRNDPDGNLYIYYDDGNTTQFVPVVALGGTGGGVGGPGGVAGGDLTGNYPNPTIADNTINLAKMGAGAATGAAVPETLSGQTTTFTNSETTIYTKSITTTNGGGILVLATPLILLAAGQTYTITLRLKIDAATVATLAGPAIQVATANSQVYAPSMVWFASGVSAAAHTITLTAQRTTTTGTTTFVAISFLALETA